MSDIEARVREALGSLGADFDEMECDPSLADTAAFCEAYDVDPEDSANCILMASRKPEGHLAVCVVLAPDRLDGNGAVRRLMGVRKLSFAPADRTAEVTGMEIGGVTPFGLPEDLEVLVDARVMSRARVVVGGGSRSRKFIVDPEVFGRMPNTRVEQITVPRDDT